MAKKKDQIVKLLVTTYLSQQEIADKVGCKQPYVAQVVREVGTEVIHTTKMDAFRLKCQEMLLKKIEQFNDQDSAVAFKAQIMGMDRLAKFLGWDAPERHQVEMSMPSIEFNQRVINVDAKVKDDDGNS